MAPGAAVNFRRQYLISKQLKELSPIIISVIIAKRNASANENIFSGFGTQRRRRETENGYST